MNESSLELTFETSRVFLKVFSEASDLLLAEGLLYDLVKEKCFFGLIEKPYYYLNRETKERKGAWELLFIFADSDRAKELKNFLSCMGDLDKAHLTEKDVAFFEKCRKIVSEFEEKRID